MPRAIGFYQAFQGGYTADEIADVLGMPVHEIEERIAAAVLCFEQQVRLEVLNNMMLPTGTGLRTSGAA